MYAKFFFPFEESFRPSLAQFHYCVGEKLKHSMQCNFCDIELLLKREIVQLFSWNMNINNVKLFTFIVLVSNKKTRFAQRRTSLPASFYFFFFLQTKPIFRLRITLRNFLGSFLMIRSVQWKVLHSDRYLNIFICMHEKNCILNHYKKSYHNLARYLKF